MFNKNFLIITAHPDDLEAGCGGLVAKVNANGGNVTNLILVKPSAEVNYNRDASIVRKELANSVDVLKFNPVIYNTPLHENKRPNLIQTTNLVTYAEKIAKDHDILITHWKEDHHQDHRVCYDLAKSIARKGFEKFFCMDQVPYNLHYENFKSDFYVDITENLEVKIKALECYSSYYSSEAIETIINYNKYRGSFLGNKKVAETFKTIYNKQI